VRERAELEMDAGEALQHGIGTVQDITERKLAEDTIKASLKEKELLLKEIHHRVKNNLQIVSSLLYLQSTKTEDEATRATFLESLNRIKSMALLHEELYRSGDLQRVNFGEYLSGFISILKESYMKPDSPIDIHIENSGDKIDFDKAIYCGLIINELVSNALKYAFPGNKNGKIEIGLAKKENQFILTVSDNGIGMKNINELSLKKSMGLLIVERLVDQLNGTMEHQTVGGTTFIIKFEEKEP
jgi:two-component sensor histidine kinase